MLKKVEMLDSSNNALGKNAYGNYFYEPWEYASVVGMLMYLYSNYRPDIQFTVQQYARFTYNSRKSHSDTVNRICRYLVGMQGKVLTFDPNSDMNLDCYVDAYFPGLWEHKDDKDPVCLK